MMTFFHIPCQKSILKPKSKLKVAVIFLSLPLFLSGCSKTDVEDYKDNKPVVQFKEFYSGPVEAWGIIQDFNDKVIRTFTIQINGQWQDNKGSIEEIFHWSDDTTTHRVWHFDQISDHQFKATTDDMDGDAIGIESGNAIYWQYKLKVPINGEVFEFDFEDWSYAIDGEVLINRSKMKKMGITVGNVTIMMKKKNVPSATSPSP